MQLLAVREDERQQQLERDFWGSLLEAGAILARYDGTPGGAADVVRPLLRRLPTTLLIQQEMSQGLGLADTTAGQQVSSTIAWIICRDFE